MYRIGNYVRWEFTFSLIVVVIGVDWYMLAAVMIPVNIITAIGNYRLMLMVQTELDMVIHRINHEYRHDENRILHAYTLSETTIGVMGQISGKIEYVDDILYDMEELEHRYTELRMSERANKRWDWKQRMTWVI